MTTNPTPNPTPSSSSSPSPSPNSTATRTTTKATSDPEEGRRPLYYRYHLATLLKQRDDLARVLRCEYRDRAASGPEFNRFLRIVRDVLGDDLDQDALVDSVRGAVVRPLSAGAIGELAHRLAGNLARLKMGRPALPWTAQRHPEWVPLQVLAVTRDPQARRGPPRVSLQAKVMAGGPCPRTALLRWSPARCRFLAREFGFTRSYGLKSRRVARYPYVVPEQLVNLRFEGLADPAASTAEGPGFARFRATAQLLDWNRELIKLRARIDPGYACPRGVPPAIDCHRCAIGYEHCPAGTHRRDYAPAPCPRCGNDRALFDPDRRADLCLNCQAKDRHRPAASSG